MIIKELLFHQWQKTFRSPGYYKNLTITILLGFSTLYFVGALMFFGAMFPRFVAEVMAQYTAIEAFNGILLYVVLFTLFMGYFFQSLGTINLQLYQVLPIKRSIIVNYVLLHPLLNPINYLLLAFVIPFLTRTVSKEMGVFGAWNLFLIVVFLIWFTMLTASYLKRRFSSSIGGTMTVLLLFAGLAALEYFHIFSFFEISKNVFGFLGSVPFGFAIALLLPLAAYALNIAYFQKNYYPESFEKNLLKKQVYTQRFSFMDRFGKIGELMLLHIKTFLRNKRMKSTVYLMPVFLLYGFLFYTDSYSGTAMYIFAGIFITGFPMIIIGQWAFAMNSICFDAIMSKKITAKEYVQSYYYLMVSLGVICFILTTPYFLHGKEVALSQTIAFLYNTGINVFVLLFMSTFNNKRLILNTGGAFNYQGTSMGHFLIIIPIMVVPMIIMGIAGAFKAQEIGYWILGSMGVLGIIFAKPLLTLCEKQLVRKKYYLCEGFRKIN